MKLSSDHSFNFNLLRWLGAAPYGGADIAEILKAAERIEPGNFESWYTEFHKLALAVESEQGFGKNSKITIRDREFRAASYYRAADFYLHGNPEDKRISDLWNKARIHFDTAIAQLEPSGKRLSIQANGFHIPAIFFRCSSVPTPRPTILICNGFDGSQEEAFHMIGVAALERGFNVLTFEGPGQPSVVRDQAVPFRHDWESVITPVVDFCFNEPSIDNSLLGLIGISFGGYLVPRALAFEKRIKAAAVIDGLFNGFESVKNQLPREVIEKLDSDSADAINQAIYSAMKKSTGLRWFIEHGMWAFSAETPYQFITKARAYTLKDVVNQIECPMYVCQAPDDSFNPGQARQLADALGKLATLRIFTEEESAAVHAHPGAFKLVNANVLDWFMHQLK
jgi:predicted alpha/beta hydrolase